MGPPRGSRDACRPVVAAAVGGAQAMSEWRKRWSVEASVEIARLHGYRSIELRIGRYSITVSVSGWEWRLSASANRSSVGLTIGPLSMHVWEYARPPC